MIERRPWVSWGGELRHPDQGMVGDEIVRGIVQYRPCHIFGTDGEGGRFSGRRGHATTRNLRGGAVPSTWGEGGGGATNQARREVRTRATHGMRGGG